MSTKVGEAWSALFALLRGLDVKNYLNDALSRSPSIFWAHCFLFVGFAGRLQTFARTSGALIPAHS